MNQEQDCRHLTDAALAELASRLRRAFETPVPGLPAELVRQIPVSLLPAVVRHAGEAVLPLHQDWDDRFQDYKRFREQHLLRFMEEGGAGYNLANSKAAQVAEVERANRLSLEAKRRVKAAELVLKHCENELAVRLATARGRDVSGSNQPQPLRASFVERPNTSGDEPESP